MKAVFKDLSREIKKSKNRFFSIFAIIALGTGFFAGIKVTAPDMKLTAEDYFNRTNLMDLKLLSTVGFNDDDLDVIKKTEGIRTAQGGYSLDGITEFDGQKLNIRALSLDLDHMNADDYINKPVLVEGRFPAKPNEVLIEKGQHIPESMDIGSIFTLEADANMLDLSTQLYETTFEVVGIVETSTYITFERGSTSMGN